MVNALSISLSGLSASLHKAGVASSNIANTGTRGALSPENGPAPYNTRVLSTISNAAGGVTTALSTKTPGFIPAFDQNSPFADEQGLIGVPNTNLAEEIINLKLAEVSYKANLQALETTQELSQKLLSLFDEEA